MKVWDAGDDDDDDVNEGIPCTIVEFAGLRLMFDCGVGRSTFCGPRDRPLEMRTARLSRADVAGVDAVFVTGWEAAAGVPFLTERWGYEGAVYMTEPVYFAARRMLREIAEQETLENYAKAVFPPPSLSTSTAESNPEKGTYTVEEVESSFRRFTPVKYGERIDLFAEACAQCASSGHEIGGAYWAVETVAEKIVYLGDVALHNGDDDDDGSCRHPLPFDGELLRGADVVLVGTSPRRQSATKSYRQALDDACAFIARNVQEGGRVLVPCFPLSVMYDLVERIRARIFTAAAAAGSSQYKIIVVSPAAHDMLQFSGVLSEWVEPARAARAFVPTELFGHAVLMRTGQLRCLGALDGNVHATTGGGGGGRKPFEPLFDRPSIVFCSHPACRFFDAQHLLRLFLGDGSSKICLVEPDYIDPALEAIRTIGGSSADWAENILVEPVDARPPADQLGGVLDGSGARKVIYVGRARTAPQPQLARAEVVGFPEGGRIDVELEPQFATAEFTPKLAQSIHLSQARVVLGRNTSNKRMAGFRCRVKAEHGKYVLDVAEEDDSKVEDENVVMKKRARMDGHFFGVPRAQRVVSALAARGADRIEPLEVGEGRTVMRVGRLEAAATVVLTDRETTVVSDSEEFSEWVSQAIENDCLHSVIF